MRVVIADDNLLVRAGIASLLRDAEVEVVAEAANAEDLLREVDQSGPTSRSSTSACRRTTGTRACAPRTRSARGTPGWAS